MAEHPLWEKVARGVGAVIGITSPAAILEACAPQPPAQVKSIELSPSPVVPVTAEVKVAATTVAGISEKATPPPVATATPPEFTPTTPPTIATSTATVAATETPKPPENPLPSYGVFFGNVTDPATGAKLAEMVMASIPQKDGDEIFVYYITSKNRDGSRAHGAIQWKPRNIKGTHFELGWMPPRGKSADYKTDYQADYNEKEGTIEGMADLSYWGNGKFKLKSVGKGKEVIFKAMRQVISDQSSDQPTTPEKELAQSAKVPQFGIKADLWP